MCDPLYGCGTAQDQIDECKQEKIADYKRECISELELIVPRLMAFDLFDLTTYEFKQSLKYLYTGEMNQKKWKREKTGRITRHGPRIVIVFAVTYSRASILRLSNEKIALVAETAPPFAEYLRARLRNFLAEWAALEEDVAFAGLLLSLTDFGPPLESSLDTTSQPNSGMPLASQVGQACAYSGEPYQSSAIFSAPSYAQGTYAQGTYAQGTYTAGGGYDPSQTAFPPYWHSNPTHDAQSFVNPEGVYLFNPLLVPARRILETVPEGYVFILRSGLINGVIQNYFEVEKRVASKIMDSMKTCP